MSDPVQWVRETATRVTTLPERGFGGLKPTCTTEGFTESDRLQVAASASNLPSNLPSLKRIFALLSPDSGTFDTARSSNGVYHDEDRQLTLNPCKSGCSHAKTSRRACQIGSRNSMS